MGVMIYCRNPSSKQKRWRMHGLAASGSIRISSQGQPGSRRRQQALTLLLLTGGNKQGTRDLPLVSQAAGLILLNTRDNETSSRWNYGHCVLYQMVIIVAKEQTEHQPNQNSAELRTDIAGLGAGFGDCWWALSGAAESDSNAAKHWRAESHRSLLRRTLHCTLRGRLHGGGSDEGFHGKRIFQEEGCHRILVNSEELIEVCGVAFKGCCMCLLCLLNLPLRY